ncbi:AMP-binding protein [Pseudanabaena sp. ABRG5-3]|uniref:AMP-binding protein n=1 Tax=Pseudanabaena sp. ABRG5-3 TaxID=685565 RepID=UPI000DC6ECF6|nr:AMP-binding protein [Pseudanabaena sp. ABRG5-3]BBC27201.1 AMP-dependent synthetase and ligase [Pseudanabaena sp. ABRG5-3]
MFDFQGKQPSTSLSVEQLRTFLGAVETALMLEPTIKSAIVRLKKEQLVAYVVTTSQLLDVKEIHRYLQNLIPLEWIPHIFIPLVTLPFNSLGELDELALGNIPVIDDHLAAQWEDLIRQQPDIEKVAVVVSDRPKPTPPLHLSDLLPNWVGSHRVHTPKRIEPISHRSNDGIEIKSDRLAISHGEPLQLAPDSPLNLAEALKQAASKSPNKGIIYITDDGTESQQTYGELLTKAQAVMSELRQLGLHPQDKVIFQLKDNSDFLAAFWGCILGGFIPVPLSVAKSYQELNNNVKKLHSTWELLDRPVILTNRHLVADIQSVAQLLAISNLRIAEIESISQGLRDLEGHDSKPEDLAILLLTSGSTGNPKAVMQTHQSILKRSLATIQRNQFTSQDISLNWMPLDHVGGIIMFHIRDVCLACQQIHVATEFILGQPLRWLDLIDHFRATVTWAPNFAYGLINSHLESSHFENKSPKTWDLSSMRFILNGGEAVVPKVARLFLQRLQSYSLSQTAMHPAWGMSETCSGVIYSERFSIDSTSDRDAFVEVGDPVPEFSVRIVDQDGNLVLETVTGIVQVQGSMVTKGYYGNLEANQEAFTIDGWFNTGDLGMLREGRLTITGRQKDTIIINGINYYSHEIEGVIEEIKGVAISFTAAIAARDGGDTDCLVIFFSPIAKDETPIVNLMQAIRERILQSSGIYPDYVIPVEATTVPKTAIGKIQRSLLKQLFEDGEFNHIIKKFDILEANSNTIPDWFFRKAWHRQELRPYDIPKTNRILLIFFDSLGLGESISQILSSESQTCIKVEIGSEFSKFSSQHYAIAPNKASHYRQLIDSLAQDNLALTDILHLWTYDEARGEISSIEDLEQAQEYGLYSLLFLVQALAQAPVQETNQAPIKLRVVSSHAQAVIDNEAIAYAKPPLLGITKAIPAEIPWLNCQHIDLSHSRDSLSNHTAFILQEFSTLSKEAEISYRDGQRFVSRLARVDFSQSPKQEVPFKHGGTYLLTGGLGGIGLEIAKYLLREYQARLLIVGRTPLPSRSSWAEHLQQSNPIADKILAYQSLEQIEHQSNIHSNISNIIYQAVNITDLDALKSTIAQAQAQWQSNLDGIIHLAGIYHEAALVDETPESIANILSPKMAGTWILDQLLKDNPNSIFISFSSIIGYFSGSKLGAYAAANSFLEGFHNHQRHQQRSSYCLAWSMWDEVGMSQGYAMKELIRAKGRYTLTPLQGIQSFISCLHHRQSQAMIGLEPANPSIRKYLQEEPYNLYGLTAFLQRPTEISNQESTSMLSDRLNSLAIVDAFKTSSKCRFVQIDQIPLTTTGDIDRQKLMDQDKSFHGKQVERIAPRNAAERQIAKIWQDVLKVPQISVNDNFFELGGQSLLATQVTSRIREMFRLDLELSVFFKAPTIAGVINSLTSQAPAPTYIHKVAELREKISTMSPTEIQARLYKNKNSIN